MQLFVANYVGDSDRQPRNEWFDPVLVAILELLNNDEPGSVQFLLEQIKGCLHRRRRHAAGIINKQGHARSTFEVTNVKPIRSLGSIPKVTIHHRKGSLRITDKVGW